MEQNNFLTKVGGKWLLGIMAVIVLGGIILFANSNKYTQAEPLRVGISPYQDLAMIVNIEPLGLEKKYGVDIDLVTMPWEEIFPAVTSAGRGLDIGFASYIEYLTKMDNINAGSDDPLLFVYPVYVFKGGAFVTFKDETKVPTLNAETVKNPDVVAKFLSGKLGAQKSSLYEMMLYHLALQNGINPKNLNIIDTPFDQGFLAAEGGSLDIATAGLTQLTETTRRGGRAVLVMDDLGFADLTGFVVKKSVLEAKKPEIEALIKMWFDSVDYVYSDIDKNSKYSLAYLDKNASTRYSLEEYKKALSQEYLPRSVAESKKELIDESGKFSYLRIGKTAQEYLFSNGIVKSKTAIPTPILVK